MRTIKLVKSDSINTIKANLEAAVEADRLLAQSAKTDAETAQSLSEAARDKSQEWAENPEDVSVEAGKYSAKHYSLKAAASAAGIADSAEMLIKHEAEIASLENTINSANINQETTATVTGVDTVALPKTAANTGMQVQLFGQSAENLIVNGRFDTLDYLSEWNLSGWDVRYTAIVNSGLQLRAVVEFPLFYKDIVTDGSLAGHKIYFKSKFKIDEIGNGYIYINDGVLPYYIFPADTNLKYQTLIYTTNPASTSLRIGQSNLKTSGWQNQYISEIMAIDLTATFGAGNEPTKAQCDILFANYFEGSDNVLGTGRVRSVGKNLIDVDKIESNVGLQVEKIQNGIRLSGVYNTNTLPIKIDAGTTIICSYTAVQISGTVQDVWAIYYEDGTVTYHTKNNPVTLPKNMTAFAILIELSGVPSVADFTNIQLEIGSTATTYEPYRESSLYLTTPELRSNGLIKDEIHKGTNGYELVKRVGVGTLGSELVVNGTFDSDTGWEKGTGWTISGEKAIGINTETTGLVQNVSVVPGKWHRLMADIIINSGFGLQPQIASFVITNNWSTSGKKIIYFKPNFSGNLILYGIGNFNIEVDNVSLKELTTADIIADASLFTEIGSNVHYTLATPVITPVANAGLLNSNSNGTAYFEPIIADAGVYASNLTVQLTDYPIASFESIRKYANGTYTDLNTATAVIASGGLSFTHPDLVSGDLVMFTYAYSNESIGRSMTLTHYDSRFVEADTANGKVYRWGVTITNGVPTLTVTEV